MRTILLAVSLLLPSSCWPYALQPTDRSGRGPTVEADQPPVPHVGRTVALPVGTELTVKTDSRWLCVETALIGPAGIERGCAEPEWKVKLAETGGYKLQFGSDQIDFVVTDDSSTVAGPERP